MESQAKQIVGLINETLKGHRIVFKQDVEEKRAHKIISAIIGDMVVSDPITRQVLDYCKTHYNYK